MHLDTMVGSSTILQTLNILQLKFKKDTLAFVNVLPRNCSTRPSEVKKEDDINVIKCI